MRTIYKTCRPFPSNENNKVKYELEAKYLLRAAILKEIEDFEIQSVEEDNKLRNKYGSDEALLSQEKGERAIEYIRRLDLLTNGYKAEGNTIKVKAQTRRLRRNDHHRGRKLDWISQSPCNVIYHDPWHKDKWVRVTLFQDYIDDLTSGKMRVIGKMESTSEKGVGSWKSFEVSNTEQKRLMGSNHRKHFSKVTTTAILSFVPSNGRLDAPTTRIFFVVPQRLLAHKRQTTRISNRAFDSIGEAIQIFRQVDGTMQRFRRIRVRKKSGVQRPI